MKLKENGIIIIFSLLTVVILAFNYWWQDQSPALILKFGVRLLLVATALAIKKKNRFELLIGVAFALSLFSDFFFVLMRCFHPDFLYRDLLGIIGFIGAYLFLIGAFKRGFKLGLQEIVIATPFTIAYLIVLFDLYRYAQGALLLYATILGLILIVMATVLIATWKQPDYPRRTAWLATFSAVLLFVSDIVVAYALFHPNWQPFILFKENIIWATYMAGWLGLLKILLGKT